MTPTSLEPKWHKAGRLHDRGTPHIWHTPMYGDMRCVSSERATGGTTGDRRMRCGDEYCCTVLITVIAKLSTFLSNMKGAFIADEWTPPCDSTLRIERRINNNCYTCPSRPDDVNQFAVYITLLADHLPRVADYQYDHRSLQPLPRAATAAGYDYRGVPLRPPRITRTATDYRYRGLSITTTPADYPGGTTGCCCPCCCCRLWLPLFARHSHHPDIRT